MSLPSKAIDRLFDRLAATYGRQWFLMWEGVEASAVKALWGHELASFENRMEPIAWALENLPAKCLNAIEFKNLCRQAPAPVVPQLPTPKADPERVKAELAKLVPVRQAIAETPKYDRLAWAKAILRDHMGGLHRTPTVIAMARNAIGEIA